MAVRLSALRAGRPLTAGRSWYSFLLETESTPGSKCGWIRSIEKSNDIGIRTRDLPACSIAPQPITLLHVPKSVEALCFKPEGLGLIPDEVIGFFNLPNPAAL
jgi:hypothetical protein